MASPNRGSQIAKLHKVLKKHFKPVAHAPRPVLEQLLFACCLENARYEPAEQAYQAVSTAFFDWNEVRVSTPKELAEVMHMLPDALSAATNLKRTLQSAFEATYSFDLEAFKKQNLGQAIQKLKKFDGTTPFTIGYVTQTSLAGHAIPLDRGALEVLSIVGIATVSEVKSAEVGGLERAIPKNKGHEFSSLLHQLAAELVLTPYGPPVHKILLEVAPDAKDRLPKRQAKKPPQPVEPPAPPPSAAKGAAGKAAAAAAASAAKKPAVADKKKVEEVKKKPPVKVPAVSKQAAKPAAKKKSPAAKLAKRKPR